MRRDSSALRVSRLLLVGVVVVGLLAGLPAVPWLGRVLGVRDRVASAEAGVVSR